jgi:hypothetical protein
MAEMSVRYTYRLRVSTTAEALLLAEWDRDRWVWNEGGVPPSGGD